MYDKKHRFALVPYVASRVLDTVRAGGGRGVFTVMPAGPSTSSRKRKREDKDFVITTTDKEEKKKRSPPRYSSVYKGRFRKPKKLTKKGDAFLKSGFVHTTEINGTVSDPEICYIGHCSYSGVQLFECIMQSMFRKLFMKCVNMNLTSVTQTILGTDAPSAANYRVILYMTSLTTGSVPTYSYDLVAGETLYSLCGDYSAGLAANAATIIDRIRLWATGDGVTSGNNGIVPKSLRLYRPQETSGATQYQFAGELRLDQEMVTIFGKSEIKIQNRTLAADASADANDVTATPICGKRYEFKGAYPKFKLDDIGATLHLFNPKSHSGVSLVRGADITPLGTQINQGLLEPPNAKIFWNCVKARKLILNPGVVKSAVVYHKIKKSFTDILRYINFQFTDGVSTTSVQVRGIGNYQLFALEEVMNVNSDQNIVVAYEVNRSYGAYFSTMKPRVSLGRRYAITQSR